MYTLDLFISKIGFFEMNNLDLFILKIGFFGMNSLYLFILKIGFLVCGHHGLGWVFATPNKLNKGWHCHSLRESLRPLFLPELVLGAWHQPGSLVQFRIHEPVSRTEGSFGQRITLQQKDIKFGQMKVDGKSMQSVQNEQFGLVHFKNWIFRTEQFGFVPCCAKILPENFV